MKSLATAQGAVEASIKARKELISGLEKLVEKNKEKLAEEETTATDLSTRKEGVEVKKREVEDGIITVQRMDGRRVDRVKFIPTAVPAGSAAEGGDRR